LTAKIIYPGTFDPITFGHTDLIKRALCIYDQVLVAVAENPKKQPIFSCRERMALAQTALAGLKGVEVCSFDGLLVEFVRQKKSKIILRGLRAVSDFEYEFQLAGMNRHLAPDIETIFLATSDQYAYISSSLVREIAALGADVNQFVPKNVAKALRKMYKN
jgi:pantetheine-phosphate adenylyltransferase